MKDRVVAARYARAFFEAAKNAGTLDKARQDLRKLAQVLRTDETVARMLLHPLTPPAEKRRRGLAALGKPSPILERLLDLVLSKKRLDVVPAIAAQVDDLADEENRVRRVHVKSAVPLDTSRVKDLEKRLGGAWGCRVAAEVSVDESLIGGLVLRVGDRVWDRSLRGQLLDLKENLLAETNI